MQKIMSKQKLVTITLFVVFSNSVMLAQKPTSKSEFHEHLVSFNYPNGPYSSQMLAADFGNGSFFDLRDFASIVDSAYCVTFKKGEKVRNTGASTKVNIPYAKKYSLEYKIKYDEKFEAGLHGKQFGFRLGVGYDGGRAEEARNNGNGGSVRIQFDAYEDYISNQLYVYYSGMDGKYGNNPGKQKYNFKRGEWHTILLTVSLESTYEAKDGCIEVYCDGTKVIDVKGMAFVRLDEHRFITGISLESFPGGGGTFPTYDNYLYVDYMKWWKQQ